MARYAVRMELHHQPQSETSTSPPKGLLGGNRGGISGDVGERAGCQPGSDITRNNDIVLFTEGERTVGTVELLPGEVTFTNVWDPDDPPSFTMLVLGISSKRGREKHGNNGEGFKATICIIHRQGGSVTVQGNMWYGEKDADGNKILDPRRWTSRVREDGVLEIVDEPCEPIEGQTISVCLEIPDFKPEDFSLRHIMVEPREWPTSECPDMLLLETGRQRGQVAVNGYVIPKPVTGLRFA